MIPSLNDMGTDELGERIHDVITRVARDGVPIQLSVQTEHGQVEILVLSPGHDDPDSLVDHDQNLSLN